jgi:hypothetical protein
MPDRYRVNDQAPSGLRLRSRPIVKPETRRALLSMGHIVEKLGESDLSGWWEVSTRLDGATLTGFVNSSYLTPADAFTEPEASTTVEPVHLRTNKSVSRVVQARMANPLNEPDQPTRHVASAPAEKSAALTAIVEWLDVENSARYAPNSQNTYCNIYAYDYCYLADVYLPRVWWRASAITRLENRESVAPIYDETVVELNANSLFNWFKEYSARFGWRRTFDLDEMQEAANVGNVAIVCGHNRIPNRSGHIAPVVPETDAHEAVRTGGRVARPLQSQAGRVNRMYMPQVWWTQETFRDWGFWINAQL